jgi:hypothetical protein
MCRFIVRQQCQAVNVLDPLLLLERFESLTGTGGLASAIAAKARDLNGQAKACRELEKKLEE